MKQSGWRLEGRYLYVKNIGRFKLFLSREVQGDVKTVTIRRNCTGNWFVAFSCDNVPVRGFRDSNAEVGIDVGVKSFCVDSYSMEVQNPAHLRQSESLPRRRYRPLCRKRKTSSGRIKARILVAKGHEKVDNQRKDFLHKTANGYVRRYGTIYAEDLDIKGMV